MSDLTKFCGLWKGESKSGNSYLSGSINPMVRLVVMPNSYKKGDKDPDYIAFISPEKKKEKEEAELNTKSFTYGQRVSENMDSRESFF